jgi:hypothetical protein
MIDGRVTMKGAAYISETTKNIRTILVTITTMGFRRGTGTSWRKTGTSRTAIPTS